jgi:hypothetical protein
VENQRRWYREALGSQNRHSLVWSDSSFADRNGTVDRHFVYEEQWNEMEIAEITTKGVVEATPGKGIGGNDS